MNTHPFQLPRYPDLLQGKKLMYVHGFGSSAQSGTVGRLREMLPSATIIVEDLPLHPQEAMNLLHALTESEKPDLILGTSMGGMYTEMLHGFDRILVNPAFEMGETMKEHGMIGAQAYQNPRKDGVQEFLVNKALVKEYAAVTQSCFTEVNPEEQKRVYGLFGDEDDTVHTYDLFAGHYPQAIRFHGGHRMNDRSFMHAVLPVIRWVDDRQENRKRPIVYLHINCLRGNFDKPEGSSQKAFGLLLEHYEVYFVAPSLSTNPAGMEEMMAWIFRYFDAPTWNHVIFTNQKHLLIGDYIIDRNPEESFVNTLIEFGSDEFKTWDAVIDYFTLLGGQ